MDKTIREDSESGDPKQGEVDLTIREEGSEVQGTDATLVEGVSEPVSTALKVGVKLASAHKQFTKLQSSSTQARAKALEILQGVLEGIKHHDGVISSAYSKMASLKDSLEQQLGNGTDRRLLKDKLLGLCRWYEATYQAQAIKLEDLVKMAFWQGTDLDQLIEQDGTLPQNRLTLVTLAYYYRRDGDLKDLRKAFSEQKKDYRPYKFGGKEYWEAKELEVALAERWEEGVKHFGRGYITKWVEEEHGDQGLTSDLMDITEDEELDGDQKLSAALLVMNEELPLMWRGEVVTREWMAANPDKTFELCSSKLPKLYDLHRSGSELNLLEIAERVNEVSGDKALQGPERESVLGLLLDENASLRWGGYEVNAKWLETKPEEAIKISQSPVLGWYERLRGRDELVLEVQRVREAEELKAKKEAEEREIMAIRQAKEAEELKAKKEAEEREAKAQKEAEEKLKLVKQWNEDHDKLIEEQKLRAIKNRLELKAKKEAEEREAKAKELKAKRKAEEREAKAEEWDESIWNWDGEGQIPNAILLEDDLVQELAELVLAQPEVEGLILDRVVGASRGVRGSRWALKTGYDIELLLKNSDGEVQLESAFAEIIEAGQYKVSFMSSGDRVSSGDRDLFPWLRLTIAAVIIIFLLVWL